MRDSDFTLDWSVDSADEVAAIMRRQDELGHGRASSSPTRCPLDQQWDPDEHDRVLGRGASQAAEAAGVRGKAVTPFLLVLHRRASGGRSLEVNLDLARNNVRVAGGDRHGVAGCARP